MRKWMRDRLQRRKKTPAAPTDQPAAPPLQPAYFDADDAPSTPTVAEDSARDSAENNAEHNAAEVSAPPPAAANEVRPVRGARSSSRSSSESQTSEAPPSESQPPNSQPGTGGLGRGRRRRGGRGRGGRGREQAVAQAFAPAAVKGSIPSLPSEPAEEDMPEDAEISGDTEGQTAEPVALAAPAAKIPAVPVAAPRPPKGVVVLAIGLPGSGKSSWFKRHNVVPLSSDMVRSLLFDDVREQRFQDLVFSNLRSMLKARLIAKRPMNYVDATNLTPQERQHWIKLAKDYQYEVHAVFFDVPLDVCLDRHQRRDRVVPEDVMRRMAAKLKAPAFEEGFAKITVVRVKKKEPEAEQIE
jgi:predicted kinase